MSHHIKTMWVVITIIIVYFLTSCSPLSEAAVPEVVDTTVPSQQNLKTTLGDFVVISAHLVDEVHDSKAPDGNKFLLIGLVQPDLQKLVPGEFSLETFQAAIMESHDEIYILGKEGSQTFYTQMGGWVDDDFVIGFTVPISETYTLYWPDNAPIPLKVKE